MSPKYIAHRGKHLTCLENTCEAFECAIKEGYDGVETDIHLTKDKLWIIHHDPTIISNETIYDINKLTLEEIKQMPLDNGFGKQYFCPTLEEYLKIMFGTGVQPVIEIKIKNATKQELKQMMKLVLKYFKLEEISIISFFPQPLLKLRTYYGKKLHLQLLVEPTHLYLVKFAWLFNLNLDIEHVCLTKEMINSFHKKGLEVNAWTVNLKELRDQFNNWGIDALTTDFLMKE